MKLVLNLATIIILFSCSSRLENSQEINVNNSKLSYFCSSSKIYRAEEMQNNYANFQDLKKNRASEKLKIKKINCKKIFLDDFKLEYIGEIDQYKLKIFVFEHEYALIVTKENNLYGYLFIKSKSVIDFKGIKIENNQLLVSFFVNSENSLIFIGEEVILLKIFDF